MKSSNSLRPLVDVCVLTAGRFDLLEKCLQSLQEEILRVSFPCSLFIVDNGSDAEDRLIHNDLFSCADRVKRINPNVGFPRGANAVIDMGKAPLAVFVSDDIIFRPGTLEKLVRRMDNPQIALCGLKLIFPSTSTDPHRPAGKVQHIGQAINIHGDVIHPLLGWSADNPKTCISKEVISVTGAAFIVRRQLFERAGKFDEAYGKGYFEDVSLCLTLRDMGYKIFIDTDAIAEHYVGATMEKRQDTPPIQMNALIFRSRWLHSGKLIWDEHSFW